MRSTTSASAEASVAAGPEGDRLDVTLAGRHDRAAVVAAMARARHAAERLEEGFGVVVDCRGFEPACEGAVEALGEWEGPLRRAGASAVVRVGSGRVVDGAAAAADCPEEAASLLE